MACDHLLALQDGAHHRRRKQDGGVPYFRHDMSLPADPRQAYFVEEFGFTAGEGV